HEDHDISAVDRAHGPNDADPFDPLFDPAPAADTGSIDQGDRFAFPGDLGVKAVARRSRDIADDGALLPEQRVQQSALADVRTPDNRDAGPFELVIFFLGLRQVLDDLVQQIAGAVSVIGRYHHWIAKAEAVVLVCQ